MSNLIKKTGKKITKTSVQTNNNPEPVKEVIVPPENIINPPLETNNSPNEQSKADIYSTIFNNFNSTINQPQQDDGKKHIDEEDLFKYNDKEYSEEDRLNYKNVIQNYYLNFPELYNTGMITIEPKTKKLELDHYTTAELNFIADAIEYYLTSGNISDFIIAFVFIMINVYENGMKLVNVDITGLSEHLKSNEAFVRNLKILKIKYSCYVVNNIPVEYIIMLTILQSSTSIYMRNLRIKKEKEALAKKELQDIETEVMNNKAEVYGDVKQSNKEEIKQKQKIEIPVNPLDSMLS